MKKIKKEDYSDLLQILLCFCVGVICALNNNYTSSVLVIFILLQLFTIIGNKRIIKLDNEIIDTKNETIALSMTLIQRLKEDKTELKKVVKGYRDRLTSLTPNN